MQPIDDEERYIVYCDKRVRRAKHELRKTDVNLKKGIRKFWITIGLLILYIVIAFAVVPNNPKGENHVNRGIHTNH